MSPPASVSPSVIGIRPRICFGTPTSPSTRPKRRAGTAACSSAAMQTAAVDRLELKSALYSALANEQFFILYQPIVELSTQEVRGVEALLRWQHPTRGVISPDEFIPTLEDSGLIIQVGQWVLEQTCAQAARWGRKGYQTTMSVNVSMRQLECDEFWVTSSQRWRTASWILSGWSLKLPNRPSCTTPVPSSIASDASRR